MFATPVSLPQWRLINAAAAAILLTAAALPVATIRLWQHGPARSVLLALCWIVAVGCVMHALVDSAARLMSVAGVLHIDFPYWASIDRRASDLQDLFFNEPWFLVEGLLWGALGWFGLAPSRTRRRWLASGLVMVTVLTVIGVLSAIGVIGKFIVA